MKTINSLPFATLAFTLVLHTAITRPATAAPRFSDWSSPVNLGSIVNATVAEQGPAMSKNGLSLFFTSTDRPGGVGGVDIWVSQRASVAAPWGSPRNLGTTVNTTSADGIPSLSRDGHWMYFNSNRPGGFGGFDVWASWRPNIQDDFGWQPPVNLGSGVNTASADQNVSFFENEEAGTLLLFLTSNRPGGTGDLDIYVSAQTADGSFGAATLVPELCSPQIDQRPMIRSDGLEIFLFSNRTGTLGGNDLWKSTRATVFDSWSPPVNLGPTINSASVESGPYLSADRRSLFFASDRPGGTGDLDIYVTTREDLNVTPRLTNLSSLSRVGAGSDILTTGFTLVGTGTKNMLIRAVGPGLAGLGVGGALADPKLALYDASRVKIAENDNWPTALSNTFASVGAFSLVPGGKDAALAISLSPGGYTLQVAGADGGAGVALVEVYETP